MFGTAVYTLIDNNRFIIIEETIVVERLPDAFEGFKILQISDLHGAYFGEHQADLVETINSIEYDMIAFTGDMSNEESRGNSNQDSQAVLDLIAGIETQSPMYWADGNWGPFTMNTLSSIFSGTLTPIGERIEKSGVILLTQPAAITREEDQIWITPVLSKRLLNCYQNSLNSHCMGINDLEQKAFDQAAADYERLKNNGEVKLLLHHTPSQTNLTVSEIEALQHLDYDLILAGHYHGGQIRLPVIGALYIPSDSTGINNSGLFPNPKDVKGISYFGSTPQYISAGLGSSKILPLLNFRLFNTPEINLITLTKSK